MAKRIYLPKMSTFSSVKGDRLLCPRRALSYYLTKTKKLRKLIKQLFITYKEGCHRAASHDAISKWIVRTISICYQCSKESDFSLARTHDTRSLSTSLALFNGLSMEEIMEVRKHFHGALPKNYVRGEGKIHFGTFLKRFIIRGKCICIFILGLNLFNLSLLLFL